MELNKHYHTVVIGAGVAGLGAGYALANSNKSFVVFDSGKDLYERDRYNPKDIVSGSGGAGLWSDGKFSFYPSSTELWRLENKADLEKAYNVYISLLSKYKQGLPKFPDSQYSHEQKSDEWFLKEYESIYLSLKERYDLINSLVKTISKNLVTNATVSYEKTSESKHELLVKVNNKQYCVTCDNLVIAGGRFSPLDTADKLKSHSHFKRFEYGVRIQGSPNLSIFTETNIKDPKYMFNKSDVQYRTFCCCRNGEIVLTDCNGILTYSGRADCVPTLVSNIGFNVRISDELLASKINKKDILNNFCHFNNIPYSRIQDSTLLRMTYGEEGTKHLLNGLKMLITKFPDLKNSTLSGPTIEGVGSYLHTDDLKVSDLNIWVVGDACGIFRGITAGFVSGYYVGLKLKS